VEEGKLSRREFLSLAAKGTIGVGIVLGAAQAIQLLQFLKTRETFMPGWKGDVPELDDDGFLVFEREPVSRSDVLQRIEETGNFLFTYKGTYHGRVETIPGLISRDSQGALYATSRKCTHEGCMVEFSEGVNVAGTHYNKVWYCNCHQGVFDSDDGRVLAGPPPTPLLQFDIVQRDEGDRVRLIGK
jgi:Rieske Fe-S protein